MVKPTGDDLVKKNTLILNAKNLNKLKPKKILKTKIRACMGEENVLIFYFKSDDKGKLTGVCNVQYLSAVVYKKIVKKNLNIYNKYVEFLPIQRIWMVYPNPR